MRNLILCAALLAKSFACLAQPKQFVVAPPDGISQVYASLQEAIDAADNGAAIYLPSGIIPSPQTFTVSKK